LADALCLLHVATREGEPPPLDVNVADVLKGLVQRPWQRSAKEPWRAYLTRLVEQAAQTGDQINRQLADSQPLYADLVKKPWPFDWPARRAVWLDLLELMLATKSGEDDTSRWHAVADQHAAELDLFRKAYIVSVRASPKPNLDWEFVRPAVVKWSRSRDPDRLRFCAETLDVLLAAGGDPPSPGRKEVAALLGKILRDEGDNLASLSHGALDALGRLYRSADERAQPEAAAILSATLDSRHGLVFGLLARAAGMPPERRRAILLAVPMRLPDEGTLGERLRTILDHTTVCAWIDDAVWASTARPDTGVLEGPRLEILEKLLARTNLRLELLESNLFWIGPPDKLAAARQVHAQSLQRAAAAQGKPAVALMDDTRLEFVQTPLQDVIAFLRDQHDIPFDLLAQRDKPITMNVRSLPLHLALTRLARLIDGDWCAAGDTIYVGQKERLATVQRYELNRLRRWARLGLGDNAVTRALRAETRMEFIKTPLSDVAAFLAEQHKVPIQVGPAQGKIPITHNLKGISLEEALDLLCRHYDLRWDTDGQSIQIGAEADAAGLRTSPPGPKQ
jgi:hypothetical protein